MEIPITSEQINNASVFTTIATFLGLFVYGRIKNKDVSFQDLFNRSLAGSAVPTGIVIVLCALDLTLVEKMGSFFRVCIALSGLSLIYVSASTVVSSTSTRKEVKREHEEEEEANKSLVGTANAPR